MLHDRTRLVFLFAISALLALGCTACCWADGTAETSATGGPAVQSTGGSGKYDIDAARTDIKLVLEALARRSGANIVVSQDVTGDVTAQLKQMSVDAILECLSVVHGFGWKNQDGTYLVAAKEKLQKPVPDQKTQPPAPVTLVWECRHIKPADVTGVIEKLFPAVKAALGPGPVSPALSNSGPGMSGGVGGSAAPAPPQSAGGSAARSGGTKVVLIGDPTDIDRARDVLQKLDVPRKQVSIDVSITEIKSSAARELGVEWSWTDLTINETAPSSGIRFGKFTREGMSFSGVISALVSSGKANLMAQPNIAVLDGECADILIGERILFPKLVAYSQFGTPIYDKEEERVGIYLQIAPKVTADDEVVLTLYPQVSLVTSFLKTQAGDYPQISTREARTTVSVKSGASLAIGGLIRDDEIKNTSKVPLLGDLPVIGGLFRHTKKTTERTEIVIFLTPKIIEEKRQVW